jgi:hypothetical protein
MKLSKLCVIASAIVLVASASTARATEALVNGDFDFGAAFPWVLTTDGGGWIGAPSLMTSAQIGISVWGPNNGAAHSGNFAIGKSYGGNLNGGNQGAYQTFSTGASAQNPLTLNISGFVAGGVGGINPTAHPGSAAWWEVRLIEGAWTNFDAGTLIWKKEIAPAFNGGFGWELAAGSVDITSPTATLVLKFGAWDDWSWEYFGAYFDTFSVQVVPEPASLIALASGLLGMAGLSLRKRS